ncbi:hypothetical protein QAD02_020990 [Eretmocerus hayati]|uniref:Uncharacterized protein n=1 Tax=Eretmocerus hayati TaxID=131215 RepID=A0ACC2PS65_9HYME|nr:hypothetical protein QAD02_020990 [Eretmocerus hayati]
MMDEGLPSRVQCNATIKNRNNASLENARKGRRKDPYRIGQFHFHCRFLECLNGYYTKIRDPNYANKRFHKFPLPLKDKALHDAWRAACTIPEEEKTKSSYVCEDHFEDSDYLECNRLSKLEPGVIPKYPIPTVVSDSIIQCPISQDNPVVQLLQDDAIMIGKVDVPLDTAQCSNVSLKNALENAKSYV